MDHPHGGVGASSVLRQRQGILKEPKPGEAPTLRMEQINTQRWSSEALKAMNTHLSLLQTTYAEKITISKQLEEQNADLGVDVPAKSPYLTLPVSDNTYNDDLGPFVELNSNSPLPDGWEQFLDLKTGQAYYIDWKRCRRSNVDPRTLIHSQSKSAFALYPSRRWELEPECIEAGTSDCVSDGCNYMEKLDTKERAEVNDKLVTFPMLEEDWDLMKSRGWLTLINDNQSEITSEASSVKASTSLIAGEGDENPLIRNGGLVSLPLFPP